MPKEKPTKTELEIFESLYESIDEKKKPLAEKLYRQAIFMENTLIKLQNDVEENGAILSTVNGNGFEIIMENPAQKSYNTMINRYTALMAKLIDMLPEESKTNDELIDFIGGGKR